MLDGRDKILGILPFFHSFGFMAALWMPAVNGIGVVYHPNPLDTRVIGELVEKYRVTFLIATPTFLQAYMRRCTPESFGSLQYVLVGAEKLPERVALAFEDTFGIRPLEGYGCTECSPVVTVNGRDFRAPGFRQVAGRRGKIGHPLPGISVKVVDLDTGEPVAPGAPGMLLVKGPNVMKGYLGRPEKTAEVLHNGWYTTGDVALMEEDGFLTITDRLSRFSKIGGEMVPHIRIEDKLHELAGSTSRPSPSRRCLMKRKASASWWSPRFQMRSSLPYSKSSLNVICRHYGSRALASSFMLTRFRSWAQARSICAE